MTDLPRFQHADKGMTRFPPNVEQISVKRESSRVWLTMRRNDVELSFPLEDGDVEHLVALLQGAPAGR
ncbi:MAG: hypothetical protein GC208_09750 [Alphaproteobacteria bacterium]|nr:hypothetical protein [Alphaproteobacteria bacterium]